MKKLILISILTILSLKIVAQGVNTDEYKDYKPCKECSTEQWRNSHSDGMNHSNGSTSNNSLAHGIGSDIKNGSRRIVVFCVSIVGTLAGVLIYQKLNNEINNIN